VAPFVERLLEVKLIHHMAMSGSNDVSPT
jgi:hypothetical protein